MRILIVDDEPLILECTGGFLQRCGHEVVCADSAAAALASVDEAVGDFDVVISDVCMPGISGTVLLQKIRNRFPQIDVVLMTGYANTLDAADVLSMGACAFLAKPLKISELEIIIRQVEKRRGQSREVKLLGRRLESSREQRREALRDRIFARRLHHQIFAKQFPWLTRTRVQVRHLPMAGAGGDFVDLRPYGDGKALVMVADVCGHGIPAAFGGIALKTWFGSLPPELTPPQVLARCDELFDGTFPEEFFATAFCCVYDEKNRRIEYSLAGHPSPLIVSPLGNHRLLAAEGGAVGIGATGNRECRRASIADGEVLVAFTDGLTEEPETLLTALAGQQELDITADNHQALLKLNRWLLDTAINLQPLRAFSDDLSILALGPARPEPNRPTTNFHGKRALVFDDDQDFRLIIQTGFAAEGMEVRTRSSAENCLREIAEFKPDLVVLDVMMPYLNGLNALALIRKSHPQLPVMIVSGNCAEKDARLSLGEKATVFICKPVRIAKLIAAAASLLDFRPERDTLEFDNVPDAGADWLDFVISSSSACLDLLARYLEALARQPVPEEALEHVIYCIREIAGNAIEWGNLHNPALKVRVSTVILPGRIMVKITDEGSGFDARQALREREPDEVMAERGRTGKRDGGFGLSIVRSLMDTVSFNAKGNAVVMTKDFTDGNATTETTKNALGVAGVR